MPEIKLCPFCGSIPTVSDIDDVRDGGYVPDDCLPAKMFEISCRKCNYEMHADTQELTLAKWNSRYSERESSNDDLRDASNMIAPLMKCKTVAEDLERANSIINWLVIKFNITKIEVEGSKS